MLNGEKIYFVTRGSELIGASFDKEEMQDLLDRENSNEFEAIIDINDLFPDDE